MTRASARRAVALAAAALALAGCGGGDISRADFQQEVVSARNRIDFALEHASQSTDRDMVIDRLDGAAVDIRDAADDLDDVGAPDGFEDEADRLVEAMRVFADEIEGTVDEFEAFRLPLHQLQGLNFTGYTQVQQALLALRRQGIQVPLLGRH